MTAISALQEYSARFNLALDRYFSMPSGSERRGVEAMRYSVTNGGKRLRPYLVFETARLFGLEFEQSLNCAAALEFMHTYSLIHDDLPAMDNDDFRRGKPTCHKAFDEATAILAGDGLLTYAFELLSQPQTHSDAAVRCRLISAMSKGAGAFDGMIAGQMLDILSEHGYSDFETDDVIKHIEEMKTGRLISFACMAGAILGGASAEQEQALLAYSRGIGIAFQISDDILDVVGNQDLMGKKLRKDDTQGKLTFVSLYGLDKAKEIAAELIDDACRSLRLFGEKAQNLTDLAQFIINRDH